MTGSISASGNIMSLIDPTCKSRVVPCELCFYALFANCTSLVSAPKLPATTLANQCYRYMFGYTRITKMPELPAMTLKDGCYKYMFEGCASLTDVFDLPATTLKTNATKECSIHAHLWRKPHTYQQNRVHTTATATCSTVAQV